MTKRKPQITITDAERLALEFFFTGTIAMDKESERQYVESAKKIILNLLERSKRKEDF